MASCDKVKIGSVGSVKLWRLKSHTSAFFFETGMAIDADGAPNAYHPNDAPGLDKLSHAGRTGNWWGIETDCRGKPIVQRTGCDPFPGFFISKTSLQDSDRCKSLVEKQVDASNIPYIALPAAKLSSVANLKKGDIAAVINKANCTLSFAIYADVKNSGIGEGSIALADALQIPSNPRTGGVNSGIIYIVFPGSGDGKPKTVAQINTIGTIRFLFEWGGEAQLSACFPGCSVLSRGPSGFIQFSNELQERSTPRTRRQGMRYDVNFEAEPFQGYAEFDEFEEFDLEAPGASYQRAAGVASYCAEYRRWVQQSLNRALGLDLLLTALSAISRRKPSGASSSNAASPPTISST